MRKITILILCCPLLLITGCWDQKEIQNLAVIKVLAIDKVEDEKEPWVVSALVMDPSAGGGKSGGGEKSVAPEIPWTGSGETLQNAVNSFIKRTPRFSFYGHMSVLIIGENAAKEGVKNLIEVSARFNQTRPRLRVMVTQGMAKDIVETEPEASRTISEELKATVEQSVERLGLSGDVDLVDFAEGLLNPQRDPVASNVHIIYPQEKRGEKRAGPFNSILIEGLGVFSGDKLVGWLNKEETLGLLLLTQPISRGEIPVNFDFEGKTLSYFLSKSKLKVETRVVDGKLEADIHVKTSGAMIENDGVVLNQENLEVLQQKINERLLELTGNTVQKVQSYESDCLGLTENLYRFHQGQFKQIGSDWHNIFTQATVNITVESLIQNTGGLVESFDGR